MKNIFFITVAICLIFLTSCSKNPQNSITPKVVPILNTTTVSAIDVSSASSGGNITSDGGSVITTRGVVWSTASNPTVSLNTKAIDGTGLGNFSSSIKGLTANTKYYLRAYATNSVGTSYGSEVSFVTLKMPFLSEVLIGTQTWRTKNLDVLTYRNGDTILQVTDMAAWGALTTGAWCYYNNDSSNNDIYGKLYNWYAVNDIRGLSLWAGMYPAKQNGQGYFIF